MEHEARCIRKATMCAARLRSTAARGTPPAAMSLEIRRTPIGKDLSRGEGKRNLHDFLGVVDYVYRDDPNYVRPLDFDLKDRLSRKNPFFEHAEGTLFTAVRNGKPVGRCTAQIDREHLSRYRDDIGFFGFLDTVDDPDVATALLDAASAWLKERGMRAIRGPISLSMNEEIGCLVDGFDTPPMILMPHARPYQGALIEKAGLAKIKDVFAWRYVPGDVPPRARKAKEEIEKLPEVTARTVDRKNLERDVRIFMDIFNDAWSDNWGFVPMTESELLKMSQDLKLLIVSELTLLVSVDGEPCAIAIALPNLNALIQDFHGKVSPVTLAKLLWRLKVVGPDQARLAILGIRKKLRHVRKYAGLSAYMYTRLNEAGLKLGIRWGELSWTLEDNGPVNVGIKLMGGKVYKTYRVYQKDL
jgi:hypothetical protein